jgi:2,4-dienoyl-CoA reductase-like NADH-dependent reductase (Old Yellow Enzyme family)
MTMTDLFDSFDLKGLLLPNRIVMSAMTPTIVNTSFDKAKANAILASCNADLVAFGVAYIANPDLVERFRTNAPLNNPDPTLFYGVGAKGYTDYPALENRCCGLMWRRRYEACIIRRPEAGNGRLLRSRHTAGLQCREDQRRNCDRRSQN